ncbi:MAG TPA: cob(I)yrinic acid a,c-diamide adenosyltransferase [Patescibacteria group bacterium]|nr:cob(I)yrinic acid a,c-diamide adenosyltransferase [Patescibacteria group bacterium]
MTNRKSPLYTRKGDTGKTSLLFGERVSKASLRVDALGSLDEANAMLGVCLGHCTNETLQNHIETIQRHLFQIGAMLASKGKNLPAGQSPRIKASDVEWLEHIIDLFDSQTPPLYGFILPGGTHLGAHLHFARAVVRRGERKVTALHEQEAQDPQVLAYLNRLSDFLFALARFVNHQDEVNEKPWKS